MNCRFYLFALLVLVLHMPLGAYSQCADVYDKGISLMGEGKYTDAISYFQAAKQCDNSLTKQCDAKIRECRRRITPNTKSETNTISYKINLDNLRIDFGAEETGTKAVKVNSEAIWECTSSNPNWCTVVKKSESSLAIQCKVNETTEDRIATIQVRNDKEKLNIEVNQKGMQAILRFAPDQNLEFGKEGRKIDIYLQSTIEYKIDENPDWVKILSQDMDKIVVRVEPLKGKDKERNSEIIIVSKDGTKRSSVEIKQYKKLPKKTESEDTDSRSNNNDRPKSLLETLKIKKSKQK